MCVWGGVHAGRTGLLGVAFVAGDGTHSCERVFAAAACAKVPPGQHLARGSCARALVWQRTAVDSAITRIGPRRGVGVPGARG